MNLLATIQAGAAVPVDLTDKSGDEALAAATSRASAPPSGASAQSFFQSVPPPPPPLLADMSSVPTLRVPPPPPPVAPAVSSAGGGVVRRRHGRSSSRGRDPKKHHSSSASAGSRAASGLRNPSKPLGSSKRQLSFSGGGTAPVSLGRDETPTPVIVVPGFLPRRPDPATASVVKIRSYINRLFDRRVREVSRIKKELEDLDASFDAEGTRI